MAVATQSTERPDVRVTPEDLRGDGRLIRVGMMTAIPARPLGDDEADAVVHCFARHSGHIATLLIDGDYVVMRSVGLIPVYQLAELTKLADAVARRVKQIINDKRETCHAS